MNARDLRSPLKKNSLGWLAISKKNIVVAKAQSFSKICEKVKGMKRDILLVPAVNSSLNRV
ncbi:MAG TPA: hypothetical protein DCX25_01220 [Candidatus Pacebacteria bacterium]|nr:MAG: hypothetical protein UX00_C0010G0032 [Microgenomates group bacterium GW2011_GWB1_45_17]KKU23594.1 MAG: hypothetical protein UX36_C0004G0047 [Microgenomates group bacterium GW2011_GWC1_46_15]KKU24313.1 MAG: hypothetical protein UX35_C0002G0047 [Microgenomates group bacterium GW2011_GWA1_46_15]HAV14930.1 hypothetical protein [Candidatus Paceibacterota bacterium]HCR11319.1 hypothetical protein [Candidatus Paceibacterota bacterium]